jgi:hypothetical protein
MVKLRWRGRNKNEKQQNPAADWIAIQLEKNAVRKNLKYQKKNKRVTRYHRLLHTPRGWRWWWRALVPLIDWGRAADWVIEKNAVRKNWNGGVKLKTSGKLTITAFSMQLAGRDGGDRPSFPWLTEGGRLARPMGQQLNSKEKLCKKVSNVEEYQWEENSPSLLSPHDRWAGEGSGSSYLPCRLREGRWHGQRVSNLIEKRSCDKKFGMMGRK